MINFATNHITNERAELAALVEAAQNGDRDAFNRLFEQFDRVVFCVCFKRLRNEAEAQEVSQDVFIQVMLKIKQLNDPACFGGWIRQIAARMAINRATRRRSMLPIENEEFGPCCGEDETPAGIALAQESRAQVREGMGRLSDLDRQTLEAFYFRGESLIEMSDSFGSPVGTIKRRLHTARKRLQKELAELAPA